MNQGLFSRPSLLPAVNQPCPLHLPQSNRVIQLSLVWLPGCYFILYLLWLGIYFVLVFAAYGGCVLGILVVLLVLALLVLVVSMSFRFVSCGSSFAFQSSRSRGLLIFTIMAEYQLLVHRRFHCLFHRGWVFVVRHPRRSFTVRFWRYSDLFSYHVRIARYELGVCSVPYH